MKLTHGVEIEFRRGQTGKVGILYETSGFGTVIILDEMRQGSFSETERNSFSLNVLLTHTSNNLKKIQLDFAAEWAS